MIRMKINDELTESVNRYFEKMTVKPGEPRCEAVAPWEGTACIMRRSHSGMHVDEGRGWWSDKQAEEETERIAALVHGS